MYGPKCKWCMMLLDWGSAVCQPRGQRLRRCGGGLHVRHVRKRHQHELCSGTPPPCTPHMYTCTPHLVYLTCKQEGLRGRSIAHRLGREGWEDSTTGAIYLWPKVTADGRSVPVHIHSYTLRNVNVKLSGPCCAGKVFKREHGPSDQCCSPIVPGAAGSDGRSGRKQGCQSDLGRR